jgi:hypothetical protein
VTLFVRDLVDPSGTPFVIQGNGQTSSADAALSSAASISSSLRSSRLAATALSSTFAVSASMATGTNDLSSQILRAAASSWNYGQGVTYRPGSVVVPGWGGATYTLTVSNTWLDAGTPGIGIRFVKPPNPSNPNVVFVQYTVADRNRRIFHTRQVDDQDYQYARFGLVNGLLIEPAGTVGSTTTVAYYWDPSTQRVVVDSYTGSVTTRDYGPDNAATHKIPLYFSPELRAAADGASIMAAHETAMDAIPSATRTLLAAQHVVADVTNDDSQDCLFEGATWRAVFDPTATSGIYGYSLCTAASVSSIDVDCIGISIARDGVLVGWVMLHELGHAMDMAYLRSAGHPQGIDNGSGVLTGYIHDETTVINLFATVYDPASPRTFRKAVNEWTAECISVYWLSLIPGISSTVVSDAKNAVGLSAYNSFVTYMQSIGAF